MVVYIAIGERGDGGILSFATVAASFLSEEGMSRPTGGAGPGMMALSGVGQDGLASAKALQAGALHGQTVRALILWPRGAPCQALLSGARPSSPQSAAALPGRTLGSAKEVTGSLQMVSSGMPTLSFTYQEIEWTFQDRAGPGFEGLIDYASASGTRWKVEEGTKWKVEEGTV